MRVKLVSTLTIALLSACGNANKGQEKSRMLNQVRARQFVEAWAKKTRASLQGLQSVGGDFYGRVGSLGFEYIASDKVLVARAYIFPYSTAVTSQPGLLSWLNSLASKDPVSVSNGMFETVIPRWEPDREPSLFLRIEFNDAGQSESVVVSRLLKLRDDSMVWRRTKFTDALDAMEKDHRLGKRM